MFFHPLYHRYNSQYRGSQEQQQQLYRGSAQYSSQDSLPDSPYSSQSLDSHTSQGLGKSALEPVFRIRIQVDLY